MDFIEKIFGFSPDGGSGAFEIFTVSDPGGRDPGRPGLAQAFREKMK